jgi:aspartate aminotransferase-like enzyme
MRDLVRAGIRALNLPLLVDDAHASATVTSIRGPEGLDVEALRKLLSQKYKVVLAGGQGDLKGKIFRIGHMGYAEPADLLQVLSTVELALAELGWPVTKGAAVRAAEEVLLGA